MELFSTPWWSALLAIVLTALVLAGDNAIVIADALMGIDNVLGVLGAANGSMSLVILGLLISVPIALYGSQIVIERVRRFPTIIQLGAAVLALTAAKMIIGEQLLKSIFNPPTSYADLARWSVNVVCMAGVLCAGWAMAKRRCRLVNAAEK